MSINKFRVIDSFVQHYPELKIIKWTYVDANQHDLVTVYTDQQTLTVQYEEAQKRSIIINTTDGVPDDIAAKATQQSAANEEEDKRTYF